MEDSDISLLVTSTDEEKRNFDFDIFARSYVQAWRRQWRKFVSIFYAEGENLSINDGEPAQGKNAISDGAHIFLSRFPDMLVHFDSLVHEGSGKKFYWTFTCTDSEPSGKGYNVKVSGFEY